MVSRISRPCVGLQVEAELAIQRSKVEAAHQGSLLELERHRVRTGIDNDVSTASIQARLVRNLPDIVAKVPKPDERVATWATRPRPGNIPRWPYRRWRYQPGPYA